VPIIFNEGLISAASGGFIEVVVWMVELGANEFERAKQKAAEGEFANIVRYLSDLIDKR
jgi:hypothetical protein